MPRDFNHQQSPSYKRHTVRELEAVDVKDDREQERRLLPSRPPTERPQYTGGRIIDVGPGTRVAVHSQHWPAINGKRGVVVKRQGLGRVLVKLDGEDGGEGLEVSVCFRDLMYV